MNNTDVTVSAAVRWHKGRGAVIALLLAGLTGCNYTDCGAYYPFVDDKENAEAVTAWADANILGRSSATLKLSGGLLVGPGRQRMPRQASLPDGLQGSEVRIVEERADGVSAVFIGKRSYKGLLVTRDAIPGALQHIDLIGAYIRERGGRTAVMCYHER